MTAKFLAQLSESDLTPLPPQQPTPRRILVADDEPDIRFINSNVLSHHGFEVEVVEDGAAAWEALVKNRYDLLITDNQMPKVSGLELIERLRVARMDVPVILATGTVRQDEFNRAAGGISATLLLKPYTTAELLGMVAAALQLPPAPAEPIVPRPAAPLQ